MLTRKGYWVLAVAVAALAPAILFGTLNTVLLCLTLLLWFGYQWVKFALEVKLVLPKLKLRRTVNGAEFGRTFPTLGQTVTIDAALVSPLQYDVGVVSVQDRVPEYVRVQGKTAAVGRCKAEVPISWQYELECTHPGRVRFEGVSLEFADDFGLFKHRGFMQLPVDLKVRPGVLPERDLNPGAKKRNILPLQGIHRHRRPGSGTELLDLRDYIPGDPPKTIAWKVSARRDRLVTKEYESEVPVRSVLFLDASDSVKAGRLPDCALVQSSQVVVSLAKQLIAHRDPVGLCWFDDTTSSWISPSANGRQLPRIQSTLSEVIAKPAKPKRCAPEKIFDVAYRFVWEVYPQLMTPDVNASGSFFRRIGLPGFPWYVYANLIVGIFSIFFWFVITPPSQIARILAVGIAVFGAGLLVLVFLSRWWDRSRGKIAMTYHRRKQLAAVIASWEQSGPGGIALLQEDSEQFSLALQRFLNAHRVHFPIPHYSPAGEYLWKCPAKLKVLSERLLHTAARGKDNEMYVLFVDLLEVVDAAADLLTTIKVVQSKHHHVLIVCPWPRGLPLPDSPEWPSERAVSLDPLQRRFKDPLTTLHVHELAKYKAAYDHLRGQLNKTNVPLICAAASDSVPQVLERIERIRLSRTAVAGGRKRWGTS